jgi:uncharacterized alkaline shock family protein YloU
MIRLETHLGGIEISHDFFSSLVGRAASECFGVVEWSPARQNGLYQAADQKGCSRHRVRVHSSMGKLVIDLHIAVTYGMNISAIVKSIINKVRYTVEEATGLEVSKVNVYNDDMKSVSDFSGARCARNIKQAEPPLQSHGFVVKVRRCRAAAATVSRSKKGVDVSDEWFAAAGWTYFRRQQHIQSASKGGCAQRVPGSGRRYRYQYVDDHYCGQAETGSDGGRVFHRRGGQNAAAALLRGARGNSGVILSLLFRGFSKGLVGKREASCGELAQAYAMGVESAYKAVMKPTEGTMLTVSRLSSEHVTQLLEEDATLSNVAFWEAWCFGF